MNILKDYVSDHSDANSKVSIVAVVGTHGNNMLRLIAYLAYDANYYTGYTTTEGVYINNQLIYSGDYSGLCGAEVVLNDQKVNFAVLECARRNVLHSGIGFDACDVSVIMDYLESDNRHTQEDLAQVKVLVACSTKKTGYIILNADDHLIYDIKTTLACNSALFSRCNSPRIKEHCRLGGIAAYIKDGSFVLQKGSECIVLGTMNAHGMATPRVLELLAASLVGIVNHFPVTKIIQALQAFYANTDSVPESRTLFYFPHCQVMVDYANNEEAYDELKKYIASIQCTKKIGIIGASGNRCDEDIENLGFYAASIFDEIIIRHDKDGKGRTNREINHLIVSGVLRSHFKPQLNIISDEVTALDHVMGEADAGTFIFCAVEDMFATTHFLKKKEERFQMKSTSPSRRPEHNEGSPECGTIF